jgi:hypothetical protein
VDQNQSSPEYLDVTPALNTSDTASISTTGSARKRRWFRSGKGREDGGDSRNVSVDLDGNGSMDSGRGHSRDRRQTEADEDMSFGRRQERDSEWGLGDDAGMGLS